MAPRTLHALLPLRGAIIRMRNFWLRMVVGAHVDGTVQLSLSSRLLPGRRGSILVGSDTLIAFKTLIYTRDPDTGADRPVRIGSRCFIGGGSMIAPGVTIGDGSIVGGGAVVLEDVPARCIVGGNPARLLRTGVDVGAFGRLAVADENTRRLWGVES